MNLFLDTSSLFKMYHSEDGTQELLAILSNDNITKIFLSELTKIEFTSTIWKKLRTKEFTELQRKSVCNSFESDFVSYDFIEVDKNITTIAKDLIDKYGKQGLRTLDSIQLATAISLKSECELFITTDKLLHNFFLQESLPVL